MSIPNKLPSAMSPTDYALVVLGKSPNKTSLFAYLKKGKLPSVEVSVEYSEARTGVVLRRTAQTWVQVPESERTINKQYQKNVRAIQSDKTRSPWEWILEIDPETLPDCPKLTKRKQVERDLVAVRKTLLPYFTQPGTHTKPSVVDQFMANHSDDFPDLTIESLGKVIDWLIRREHIRPMGRHPQDRRQTLLELTTQGEKYARNIAEK